MSTRERNHSPSDYRVDKKVIAAEGARAGWYKGSNSSCRRHIARVHYDEYSRLCKAQGIEEQTEAIPKSLKEERARAAAAAADEGKKGKGKQQSTLDLAVRKVEAPTAFLPDAILRHVTILIVTSDQVRSELLSLQYKGSEPTEYHSTASRDGERRRFPQLLGDYATKDPQERAANAHNGAHPNHERICDVPGRRRLRYSSCAWADLDPLGSLDSAAYIDALPRHDRDMDRREREDEGLDYAVGSRCHAVHPWEAQRDQFRTLLRPLH